ncbi:LOW QUALITY PROTEIN: LIM/homeobox protein Lhx9-like, partial [Myotis lucifugus]|uniref:LOW QUALITY PROTEIN: LIM/homeobox protein Lhx9-like n=3 Tax=Myotis TaxID=9434 RepID=UPI0006D7370E
RFSVQRCARCHLGISASEMVMRARDAVYHLSCFTCSTCGKTLATGDHFGMKDGLVYCRAHFESLLHGEFPAPLSYTELAAKGGGLALPYFNGTGTVQKGRPRKRKSPALGVDIVNYSSGCNENEADPLDRDQQPYPPSQKTKRMRTSFKHHQLRTMKSYFAINHNPDAKDLKQLAQKTGLTKRVLQVWFQNARAKFRRNLLRQENGGVDKAEGPSLPAPPPDSGALTPPGPAALPDLADAPLTVVTAVPSSMDSREPSSPSQTTLTSLF